MLGTIGRHGSTLGSLNEAMSLALSRCLGRIEAIQQTTEEHEGCCALLCYSRGTRKPDIVLANLIKKTHVKAACCRPRKIAVS